MREIIVCEKDFKSEAQLYAHLFEKMGLGDEVFAVESFASDSGKGASLAAGDLVCRLAQAGEPARVVIRHGALADPVSEAEGLRAIEDAAHGVPGRLDWFDRVCAVLEEAAAKLDSFDVIVYYDDLGEDEPNDLSAEGVLSASEAIELMRQGNLDYLGARKDERNISVGRIRELFEGGQRPYAVVVTCSDSRVVPEHIFMAGLGELFTIRVAGNVIGPSELASAVYACEHLHSKLLLVLGHTHCGAIEAAMAGEHSGPVGAITARIAGCIEGEKDPYAASVLNVRAAIADLSACPELARLVDGSGLEIHGAIYHTHSGVVDFL